MSCLSCFWPPSGANLLAAPWRTAALYFSRSWVLAKNTSRQRTPLGERWMWKPLLVRHHRLLCWPRSHWLAFRSSRGSACSWLLTTRAFSLPTWLSGRWLYRYVCTTGKDGDDSHRKSTSSALALVHLTVHPFLTQLVYHIFSIWNSLYSPLYINTRVKITWYFFNMVRGISSPYCKLQCRRNGAVLTVRHHTILVIRWAIQASWWQSFG